MTRASLLAAAVFATLALPAAGWAQATVCVIDTGKLVSESKAGKDMTTKLEALMKSEGAALETARESLKADQAALNAKTEGMDEAAVKGNAEVLGQIEAYAKKLEAYQLSQAIAERELVATEGAARGKFNKALDEHVRSVMAKKKCGAAFDRGAPLIALDDYDITDAVIAEVDKAVTTIDVEKVKITLTEGE